MTGTDSTDDWRATRLAHVRTLITQAAPGAVEERKWKKPGNPAGVPTWSQDGVLFTGETYRYKIKITFAHGAKLDDPSGVFNASLDGNQRRAIDVREGEALDAGALQALVRAAVAHNVAQNAARTATKKKR